MKLFIILRHILSFLISTSVIGIILFLGDSQGQFIPSGMYFFSCLMACSFTIILVMPLSSVLFFILKKYNGREIYVVFITMSIFLFVWGGICIFIPEKYSGLSNIADVLKVAISFWIMFLPYQLSYIFLGTLEKKGSDNEY